ncbi:MAG: UDP-N-acetylmuramate--L-alanine ligase [Gammaproteobacteria bacterium]|uniref:UDP-N-acetylmuramate--L-alanine ligase n=1 Tax=Candidatus Thiopontia autotrophica TaxID=2841688 RepID=A0A8J6P444_9GAMM|nr:UDP-N-acetylmuramate--L-alanine ligase [Candidatus Thiopontia autotrophica]
MADSRELAEAMHQIHRIHMVGIGGAGMNGIARLLLNLGFEVSGSDQTESKIISSLIKQGADINIGHDGKQIAGADVVVISSAIGADNPEVVAARDHSIPVIPRAEMLAELMRFRYGIAVAGTHGKTTTTSLIAMLLEEAGLDPTYVIGGRINRGEQAEDIDDGGAQLGSGRYLVAEADESDASFLHLQPMIAVVTNIDEDHMSTYGGDIDKLDQTFEEFIHHLPFYGKAVLCVDDPGVSRIMDNISRPFLSYGFSSGVDFGAEQLEISNGVSRFQLRRPQRAPIPITLNLPGHHNVLNALAAIAVASYLGVDDDVVVNALARFQGIARRFQNYGFCQFPRGEVQLVDDYGHHPRELAATLKAIRDSWPGRRVVLAFQPHRYSRTRDLYDDFVDVLSTADILLLMEVYPAGEEPIPGADGRSLARTVRLRGEVDPLFVRDVDELIKILPTVVEEGDLLLISGAGTVGLAAQKVSDLWKTDLG